MESRGTAVLRGSDGIPLRALGRDERLGADHDDRSWTHPASKETDQQWPEKGSQHRVYHGEWRRGEEGILADDGVLPLQVLDQLGSPAQDPSTRGDSNSGISPQVPDPVRPPAVGGDHDHRVGRTLAWKQDFPGKTGLATGRGQENPPWSALEVATEEIHQGRLWPPDRSGNEVKAGCKGLSCHGLYRAPSDSLVLARR